MFKYTVGITGMMCGMCEAHMNDAVRKAFTVKKVTSSHTKNETVIVSEADITEEAMKNIVTELGYEMTSFVKEPYKKKLFGIFG